MTLAQAGFLERGACGTADPRLFTADEHGKHKPSAAREAKAVCRRCEVRVECLAWATENNMPGVWGATTAGERRKRSGTPARRSPATRQQRPTNTKPLTPGDPMSTADAIDKDLLSGATVKDTAARHGWTRQVVTARINGKSGWFLDPRTDTVSIGRPPAPKAPPAAPAGSNGATPDVAPAVDDTEPETPPGDIGALLDAARLVDDKRISKAVAKADEAITALRDLYTDHVEQETARREREEKLRVEKETIQALREQLAQAEANLKALGGAVTTAKKPSTAKADKARLTAIRVWAAAEGIEVASRGRIPEHVVDKYEAAHAGAGDG